MEAAEADLVEAPVEGAALAGEVPAEAVSEDLAAEALVDRVAVALEVPEEVRAEDPVGDPAVPDGVVAHHITAVGDGTVRPVIMDRITADAWAARSP